MDVESLGVGTISVCQPLPISYGVVCFFTVEAGVFPEDK